MSIKPLSQHGYQLRELLAEQGVELTPDEFLESLNEYIDRAHIGHCMECQVYTELRYGYCFDCCE